MVFFTYILYSESHQIYYKGMTSHLEKRLWQHNNDKSRFTAGKGPWKLVYQKEHLTKKDALRAEKKLKKAGSAYLKKLIEDNQGQN